MLAMVVVGAQATAGMGLTVAVEEAEWVEVIEKAVGMALVVVGTKVVAVGIGLTVVVEEAE
ncbi:unnamed protein product [Prunus armeniaca]|uniref:Uncharacterized protein n=1 Tax=Prunus armeniaca TaxID=36596 RepID=A0A6J5WPA2_PRUAR|nr:unnamed protein product [Prunus armeniaca]